MTAQDDVGYHARQHARWRLSEVAFWILVLSCALLFPSRYLIMTDILRLGLFALSLDLILGYAGVVSLGHAAFFGVGAYSAGLLALHGIIPEPVLALLAAGLIATVVGFLTSFLVIRGVDLTRLMVTLGIALLLEALAERFSNITGGSDGLQGIEMQPILGLFAFDMFGKVGFFYCLIVLFILFLLARRIVHSPYGLSLRAIRNNPGQGGNRTRPVLGVNLGAGLLHRVHFTIAPGIGGKRRQCGKGHKEHSKHNVHDLHGINSGKIKSF